MTRLIRRNAIRCTLFCACVAGCNVTPSGNSQSVSQAKEVVANSALSEVGQCKSPEGYRLNGKLAPENDPPWHVRVYKSGEIRWNGSFANEILLRDYFSRVASFEQKDQFISIEIEPGANCSQVQRIRTLAVESGLCRKDKCAENEWNVVRQYIN